MTRVAEGGRAARLPQPIRVRMGQLSLLAAYPEVNEAALLMVQQLHIAVYGETWARPEPPAQVWEMLLTRVIELAAEADQGGTP